MTAPIRSMPELIEALRNRARELQLTHETIDNVAGLQSGYTSKLLAPKPIKNLGPMSFESLLGALGVAVVVVDDPEQMAKVSGRWEKRKRPQKLLPEPLALASRFSIDNEVPSRIEITTDLQGQLEQREYMKMIGKRGGKVGGKRRLKTMSKRARQRAASHAARIRWSKRIAAVV